MRIILHQTWFFEGDVHHVNGEAEQEGMSTTRRVDADLIAECYEAAEQIRKDILARPLHIANTNVGILAKMLAQNPSLKSSSELQTKHVNLQGAILSDDIIRQSNELLQILNGK
jgi:E3 ubiquitin-protein ligase SHPRH